MGELQLQNYRWAREVESFTQDNNISTTSYVDGNTFLI